MMMSALSAYRAGAQQIVIAENGRAREAQDLCRVVANRYLPFAIVIPVRTMEHREQLAQTLPFIASMRASGGRATVYVCRDFACREPATDVDAVLHALNDPVGRTQ
jgi:uncharacterized protein YyaL (SSP411 family)